jgi:hypothetical protein
LLGRCRFTKQACGPILTELWPVFGVEAHSGAIFDGSGLDKGGAHPQEIARFGRCGPGLSAAERVQEIDGNPSNAAHVPALETSG